MTEQQPPLDTAALDAIIETARAQWNVPGVAAVIVREDEVLYLKGFGVKEQGNAAAVTPDTLFAIGSTTKAVTTATMALLVDEGKMAWDDPVRKHIPFFHLFDPLADANVTLRDLVCHRTGMSRHDMLWYNSPYTREEILNKIGLVKPTTSFRSKWEYQNIMFLAAGYAVGLVSGGTWEEFVQQRLFAPLGITGANFSARDAEKTPDHAEPHHRRRDESVIRVPWRNLDNVAPAGAINAGVRDLSKWIRFQLGEGAFEGKQIVSAANLKETHAPQMVVPMDENFRATSPETTQVSYGLGWGISDYRGHLRVEHGGGIDGFRANLTLFPREKIGIALLANLSGSPMTEIACNNIADALLGLPAKDWSALFTGLWQKALEKQAEAEKEREEKRHKETKPSRELAAYTGAYEEPAYGPAHVSLENDALTLQWTGFHLPLTHFHFDTFQAKIEPFEQTESVVFTLGADGDIATMKALNIEFQKVKPKPEEKAGEK